MNHKPLTLGQFRKMTNHLSDDIEFGFDSLVTGHIKICTMDAYEDSKIIFASRHYDEPDIMGMIRVATFLKKKN